MIRLLLNARQTLEDTAPDLPERVPVEPGDLVIQRREGGYQLFRYQPGAVETGELVFLRFADALRAAQQASACRGLAGGGVPSGPVDVVRLAAGEFSAVGQVRNRRR